MERKFRQVRAALLGLGAMFASSSSAAQYLGVIERTLCPSEAFYLLNFTVDPLDTDLACHLSRNGTDDSEVIFAMMPIDRRTTQVPVTASLSIQASTDENAGRICMKINAFSKHGLSQSTQMKCLNDYGGLAPLGRSVTPPALTVPAEGTMNAIVAVECVAPATCPENMTIRKLEWRFEANGTAM